MLAPYAERPPNPSRRAEQHDCARAPAPYRTDDKALAAGAVLYLLQAVYGVVYKSFTHKRSMAEGGGVQDRGDEA